jgi:hypothetical protein
MKKTRFLIFLLTAGLLLTSLSACGKEVISLVAVYKGDTITTTDHVFTTDDFDVYLTYSDGSEEVLTDGYEITQKGMKNGYYIMDITAKGYTEEAYVAAELDIFEKSDVAVEN